MKRFLSIILAAAMCFCLCSCGYNPETVGKVTDPEGNEYVITCGRYLVAQFACSDSALYTIDSTGETALEEALEMTIDGMDCRQWIAEETEEVLIRAAAVEKLFDEMGLELDSDTLYLYEYYISYGWSNYCDLYMANGIGYESFYDYQINMTKDSAMYTELYNEGGPLEISDDVVQEYIDNKTARVTFLTTPYEAADTSVTLTDEDYAALDTLAEQLYNDVAALGFEAAIEKYTPAYEEILGEGVMDDLYYEDERVIKGDDTFVDEMYDALLSTDINGYGIYDAGGHMYCVYRREALLEGDTAESVKSDVVNIIGPDMYEEYLSEYMEGWTIELDAKAVNYYSVDNVTFS